MRPQRAVIALILSGLLSIFPYGTLFAGEVTIVAASFHQSGDNNWSVNVTLQHGDTGWEHYADMWRVVDAEGNEFGHRILYHPHVSEQPFTRSLDRVTIPTGIQKVYIEAHDTLHGWSEIRMAINLNHVVNGSVKTQLQ